MAQPSDTQSSDTISRARPRGGGKKQGKGHSCLPQTNIGDCGGGSLLSFVCGLLGGVGLGMVEEGLARATEGQASDDCPATGGGAGQDIVNLVEPSATSADEGKDNVLWRHSRGWSRSQARSHCMV